MLEFKKKPEDCAFHYISLSQGFAMGLTERKMRKKRKARARAAGQLRAQASAEAGDADDEGSDAEAEEAGASNVIEVGGVGPFASGLSLVKAVRQRAAIYSRSGTKAKKLKRLCKRVEVPTLKLQRDGETRVGSIQKM